MNVVDSFRWLGIEVTKDQKKIKKAYAAKARQYHPERHPEEWKILYEAYQSALKYAKAENGAVVRMTGSGSGSVSVFVEKENEKSMFDELFDQLDDSSAKLDGLKEELLVKLKKPGKRFGIISKYFWAEIFGSDAYAQCREDEDIVNALLLLVRKGKYLFSSMELIRTSLQDLQILLRSTQQFELEKKVQETIERMEKRWELTEKNKENLSKGFWRKWYIGWQNYWNLPLLYRYVLFLVVYMIVMPIPIRSVLQMILIPLTDGLVVYGFISYFHEISKKERWEHRAYKRSKKDKKFNRWLADGFKILDCWVARVFETFVLLMILCGIIQLLK